MNGSMGVTAIMTKTDRERISRKVDVKDSKRYQSASRIRQRIRELEKDAEILEKHHPDLYEELRKVLNPDTEWLREELETKRNEIENEFPGVVPRITQFKNSPLGLTISIFAGDEYEVLVEDIDQVGDYLHMRGYNVRGTYDTKHEPGLGEPHYEGHLYALPSEVGIPEYPVREMPRFTETIEKFEWDTSV